MSKLSSATATTRLMLYLCIRWGHAESPEGADGEDTSFIVRATSPEQAGDLADERLKLLPTRLSDAQRGVDDRCHELIQIGLDHSTGTSPAVLAGPYVGYLRGAVGSMDELGNYPRWHRDPLTTGQGDRWVGQAELDAIYLRVTDTTDSRD